MKIQKLLCVRGDYANACKEVNEALENGWEVVKMEATSNRNETFCYVLIQKEEGINI